MNTSNTISNSTAQAQLAHSFECHTITRKLYMDGGISHQDYYAHIGSLAGLNPSPKLIERARKALSAGDEHLNTIPLREWDQMALNAHSSIQYAVKSIPGETHSLSTGVCAWKAATRASVQS